MQNSHILSLNDNIYDEQNQAEKVPFIILGQNKFEMVVYGFIERD